MVRTQIQLDEGRLRQLRALATTRSTSVAQLVREGVEQVLAGAGREQRWQQLWGVVGAFHDPDGSAGVAENHDHHLAEAFMPKKRRKR